MPEVSVVIPSYNSAAMLVDAIDSVRAQTFRDYETIVVDDGSTDATGEVARRYGDAIRYLRQANQGVSVARNTGIAESRGRFVAFLDADDVWQPLKLERQMEALRQRPEHGVCYTALELVGADLSPMYIHRSRRKGRAIEDLLMLGNVVSTPSSVMCTRALVGDVGAFDPALSYAADWDLWVRLSARTEFLYVDEPLVKYRQHPQAMSANAPLIERDNLRLLQKSFAMPALPASVRRRRRQAFARNYRVLAGIYFHAGRPADAFRCAAHAIVRDLRQARYIAELPLRRLARAR